MKILFLNRFNDYWQKEYEVLRRDFPHCDFFHITETSERMKYISIADAVVCGRLTEEEIGAAGNLKAIFVPFTGLNTFPLEMIRKRNILIFNTHANAPYVAERAVTLALCLLGRVLEFDEELRHGQWKRLLYEDNLWRSIYKMKVGIIGYGHIGYNIARILKTFDCKVSGFRRSRVNCEYAEITDDLDKVIAESELIFICLPETDQTKDMINSKRLLNMKDKYLVNVGRSSTVNEEALYKALSEGILKGAAIDVWYRYPRKGEENIKPSSYPFWELKNVILSPHKSSHTREAIEAMIDDTCNNIRSFLIKGKSERKVVC